MNFLKYLFIVLLAPISHKSVAQEKDVHMQKTQESHYVSTIKAWQEFLNANDWQELIKDTIPFKGACGLIYELPNYLNRASESFAIVDMRNIIFAEPHYHINETEIYIVLQGTAIIVVGEKEIPATRGDVIITEENTAHFTIPDKNFVIAVINVPTFKPENYIPLRTTNLHVGYSAEQFKRLVKNKQIQS